MAKVNNIGRRVDTHSKHVWRVASSDIIFRQELQTVILIPNTCIMNFNHYFQLNEKLQVKKNKIVNGSTDTFIDTSANKSTFTTVKYSFATVLINECFIIKNKCNTTRFRCIYYKNKMYLFIRLFNK